MYVDLINLSFVLREIKDELEKLQAFILKELVYIQELNDKIEKLLNQEAKKNE